MHAELLDDTAGPGRPLVYIPGIDGTGRLLLGTSARLAERFRLLSLRYRAFDDDATDTYEHLAATVSRELRAAGVDRALFLAESFGGAVALHTALDDPELVRGLMIVNSFAHYARRWKLALTRMSVPLVSRPLFRVGRRLVTGQALFAPRRDPEAVRAFQELDGVWFDLAYRRRLRMIQRLDLRPRLADVRQPIALYASDRDRIVDSVRAGRVMHTRLPNASFDVVERAGHLVLPLAQEPWVDRLEELATRSGF